MAFTTIDDPSAYFHTQLYTGNGSGNNPRAITNDANSDIRPDWIWIKERTSTSSHRLVDSSRGGTKGLSTDTDGGDATANFITFGASDGFTLTDYNGGTNQDTITYAAWQWKCNAGTTETAVDESGNNPANVRQTNTDAGFSIITYTGTGATGTIAHGLGVVPEWIVFKARAGTENWPNYHAVTGNTHAVDLNRTNAKIDNATLFNDTSPTSSVFTVSSDSAINADGVAYVCYCFAPIKGYSKFGGYTGNGNVNGAFVYTGFSPAWVMVKRTDSGNNWHMHDNKRVTSNPNNLTLYANLTNADASEDLDMLSNGFKLRESGGGYNANAGTYVYMAFAASPFVSSKGIPTTAR